MYIVIYILIISFSFSQSELSDRYTTLQEIEGRMNNWYEEFSQNTDPYPNPGEEGIIYHHEIIGYSEIDNLPIWAIKLTMNADLDEDKPKVLILGQGGIGLSFAAILGTPVRRNPLKSKVLHGQPG